MAALPDPFGSTISKIYESYETRTTDGRRGYLGPSAIGNDCDRAIWYNFRWAHEPEQFSGRMLRLFETGHREETRMVNDLRMAGVIIHDVDPKTGKQWSIEYLGGHVRGHTDGVAWELPEAPKTGHVLECKTHNEKSYKDLVSKGVAISKPAHFMQMMAYMHFGGWSRAFYIAHNKNSDELYSERVAYDPVIGGQIAARMARIVTAQQPLPKLHDNPASKMAFACTYCPARTLCHGNGFAARNCRTCLHSTPDTLTGEWRCELLKIDTISRDLQQKGCTSHLYIPGLVPGEQVDVDAEKGTVTYDLRNGTQWIDGV